MSPQPLSPPQSAAVSDIDEAADDVGEVPEFDVVTTERYASISITSIVLNLKIAERRAPKKAIPPKRHPNKLFNPLTTMQSTCGLQLYILFIATY
ncbi:unnamed protein product [Haemonchus placei]|uniref:Uncharacterized protein n=1 Tax=Haemonchus placei TaxID=6290 RepID=A0A0N4WD08_HAEPC|nr:unnamed protein product [Haemonchus placei]